MSRPFPDSAVKAPLTAVITGAASGIGAALCQEAARRGMNLVLADVDATGLAATAASCAAVEVATQIVDVSNPSQVERLADFAWQRFGRVDLLCNNAGVVPWGRHRPVWEYDCQDWVWTFGVNVIGIANGLHSFVPRMLDAGRPAHILNTTSISGFISGAGSPVYGASKHAAVRLTEGLYASLVERDAPIGVSMLCPGLVNTRIFETERARPQHLKTGDAPIEESAELIDIARAGADPAEVARQAFAGMAAGSFYIVTTSAFDEAVAARTRFMLDRTNPSFDGFVAMSRKDAT